MRTLLIGGGILIAVLAIVLFFNRQPQEEAAPADQVRVIEIEAGSYYFNPNEIRVRTGETVRIVIRSVSMMHSFVIDELGIDSGIINNGNTGAVEFTADQAGTFEYYCSVGNHRQMGQVGSLIVED